MYNVLIKQDLHRVECDGHSPSNRERYGKVCRDYYPFNVSFILLLCPPGCICCLFTLYLIVYIQTKPQPLFLVLKFQMFTFLHLSC